jgi:hypothetical protein
METVFSLVFQNKLLFHFILIFLISYIKFQSKKTFTIDFVCPTIWHTILVSSKARRAFPFRQFFHAQTREFHQRPSPLTVDELCKCWFALQSLVTKLEECSGETRIFQEFNGNHQQSLTLSVIESKLLVASSKIRIGEFLRIARAIACEINT